MPIFLYNPGNRAELQPETLRLVGGTQDLLAEGPGLIEAGLDAVKRGVAQPSEISGQLAKAAPERLPVELVARLLDPDHYQASILSPTGLAMYAPRTEGKPNFSLLSKAVEDVEELVGDGRMDRDTFEALGEQRDTITHDALQHEFYKTPEGRLQTRTHETFGYLVHSVFRPVVTVLNPEHPVRQAIKQRRAAE